MSIRTVLGLILLSAITTHLAAGEARKQDPPIDWSTVGKGGWVDASGDLFADANAGRASVWNLMALPERGIVIASVVKRGLWASADGGAHWQRLGVDGNRPPDAGQAVQFLRDPQQPLRFWVSGMYGFGCWRSDDGGQSFVRLGDATHLDGIGVDFSDPQRRTLLTGDHEKAQSTRLSTDGGKSWQLIGDRLPANSGFSTLPIVLDQKTFITNTSGWGDKKWGIWRTQDGGATWTQVSDTGPADCALVTRDGTIFYSLLWNMDHVVSRDRGLTWSKLNAPVRRQISELPDGSLVSLGNGDRPQPHVSQDGGKTWKPFGAPVPFKPCDWGARFIYDPASRAFFCYRDVPAGPGPQILMRMDVGGRRP